MKILEAGQHLVKVLGFLAVLDGLNIGIDGRIPNNYFNYFSNISQLESSSPFLLGGPHHPLLVFLVIREKKGRIDSGGRLLLDLK